MLDGRQSDSSGSPTVFETCFGWVLAIAVECNRPHSVVVSNHTSVLLMDDLIRKFWEIEELRIGQFPLLAEERFVMTHFKRSHHYDKTG